MALGNPECAWFQLQLNQRDEEKPPGKKMIFNYTQPL